MEAQPYGANGWLLNLTDVSDISDLSTEPPIPTSPHDPTDPDQALVVAGFSTEPAGESGVLAITATQIGFPAFVLLNLLAGFRSFPLQPRELETISRAIAHGNRIGLQAAPLVTQKWEEGWEKPLSQWRSELGVQVAEGEPFSATY